MRTIIDGVQYDTEAAIKMHEYYNGRFYTHLEYISESLYRTTKGEFFISGTGGALTPYGKHGESGPQGSSQIRPISLSAALVWAKSHNMSESAIAKLFFIDEDFGGAI